MHRLAACLLCAAVAFAAFAAPAPVHRTPRASGVWVKGWDEPIDPKGACRFDRKGDRLTLTMPGKRARLSEDAPHLLREVVGDFVVTVRVGGGFLGEKVGGRIALAGLEVASSQSRCWAGRCCYVGARQGLSMPSFSAV